MVRLSCRESGLECDYIAEGKTEDEALENIQDAIREYLEAAVKISKGATVREVEVPV